MQKCLFHSQFQCIFLVSESIVSKQVIFISIIIIHVTGIVFHTCFQIPVQQALVLVVEDDIPGGPAQELAFLVWTAGRHF